MALDPKKTRTTLRRVFGFAMLLVVGSVAVGSYLLANVTNRFGATMSVVAGWTDRVESYAKLDRAVHDVSAPGNDIFSTRDSKLELGLVTTARAHFNELVSIHRENLKQEHFASQADLETIGRGFDKIENDVARIERLATETINRYSAGEVERATLTMAEMNQVLGRTQASLGEVTNFALSSQRHTLATKQRAVGVNRSISWFLGAGVIATILGLVRVARATANRLETNALERERLLATLDRNATELNAYNRKLAESNRDLTDFAYVASHDLQEPLRKIIAFGDRLNSRCGDQLSNDGRDYLARMQNAASRMQILIHDLLTFSRVTTQGEAFVKTDLSRVVNGVLSDLEVAIENANATIEITDLPILDIDPGQFRQLTQNLIGNALKFRRADVPTFVGMHANLLTADERVPYDTDYPDAGEWWRISIRDNGIGFDQKYADKIFTVFQRLHGRTDYEGSGVGLAVCRRIVERHRGEIRAISRPGSGATFEIVLLAVQAASNTHDVGVIGVENTPSDRNSGSAEIGVLAFV